MNWKRDLLVIPLVVGLITSTITLLIQQALSIQRQITYSAATDADSRIEPGKASYYSFATIENTGSQPLRDISVLYMFEEASKTAEIRLLWQMTKPEYDFGRVVELPADSRSKRYRFELLNPGDEVTLLFWSNEPGEPTVHARAEGLKVKRTYQDWMTSHMRGIAIGAGFLAASAVAFFRVRRRRNERCQRHE